MLVGGDNNSPDDEIDYGTGEGAVYGGTDTDAPVFIPHPNEGNSSHDEHGKSKKANREYFGNVLRGTSRVLRFLFSSSAAWSAIASVVIAAATVVYVIYAHRQWVAASDQITQMRRANDLTQKALSSSGDTLDKTLAKMQAQTEAIDRLQQTWGLSVKAASEGNKLTRNAVEMEAGGYVPYLEIVNVTGYRPPLGPGDPGAGANSMVVMSDKTNFQFFINNASAGEARNIHYSISSGVYDDGHDLRRGAIDIQALVSRGTPVPFQEGRIDDLEGRTKTKEPIIVSKSNPTSGQNMLVRDIGEWFYGELDWDSEVPGSHGWKRVFCFAVIPRSGSNDYINSCGIPQEGVYTRDENTHPNRGRPRH